jgi:hypothetical protein
MFDFGQVAGRVRVASPMERQVTQQIRDAFEAVARSSFPETRALVEYGDIYLQLIRENALTQRWLIEAVTCDSLPPEHRLSDGRINELRRLGFAKPGRNRNWVREIHPERREIEPLVHEAVDILERIYGVQGECQVHLVHTEHEHPENPSLLRAIRHLSHSRSDEDRRRLYAELVNATLMIPVQDPVDSTTQDSFAPYVIETYEGHPIFAAFSDWRALRQWNPRGWPYHAIQGADFFEQIVALECAGVRINPDGDLGGELFHTEVRIIVEGIRAYRARLRLN